MASHFSLAGKVALITGGNGGIGLGMARGLAGAGASIMIAGRNADKSKAAAEDLSALGVETAVISVDVADPASCAAMVAGTIRELGRLDILVNNAGINIRKQPEQLSAAEWREVLSINLDGAFYCAQAAYPELVKAGGGKIINIGSMLSIFGTSFATAYAASKGGIVQMTKALAAAWAKDNIQVNAILPGWIDTELTQRARAEVDGLHDRVLARTPAARWGTPGDFGGIAVFLASPAADFVTGTAIPVDGGFSIQG
jgi:2-dehydro-3-deoxy-D-gluconate 5-dehydrogenase